jgi:hypothetical protein
LGAEHFVCSWYGCIRVEYRAKKVSKGAGAMMTAVEGVYVALMELAHGARDRAGLRGTGEQMDMVAHQDVGV